MAIDDYFVIHSGEKGYVNLNTIKSVNKVYYANVVAYFDIGIIFNIPLSMLSLYLTFCDSKLFSFKSSKAFFRELKFNFKDRFYIISKFFKQFLKKIFV